MMTKDGYTAFEERLKSWKKQRGAIERQSLNTPIQGTSADITKEAIALYHEAWGRCGRLIVVVHDELVVEVRESDAKQEAELLADCMKRACDAYLTVSPVPRPDVNIADYWEKD